MKPKRENGDHAEKNRQREIGKRLFKIAAKLSFEDVECVPHGEMSNVLWEVSQGAPVDRASLFAGISGRLGGLMAVLEIIEVPDPVLEKVARPLKESEFGPELLAFTADMAETMYAAPGVGLAAPQVGDSRRVVVIDPGEGDQKGKRLFRMANPEIIERSQETIRWDETCLSVPDLEVSKERSREICVTWRSPDGSHQKEWFSDFEAVVIQHELDHLEGTVLLDAVSGFRRRRYLTRRQRLRG